MTPAESVSPTLTGALEDYIETIFLLVRDHGFARVRDIAKARSVKSSSVSPALKRLEELGLIKYVQREYVGLTESGEREGRRVLARHDLLTRFFSEVLKMSPGASAREACALEHSLSAEAMDRFVRFFEFLHGFPESHPEWLEQFHRCPIMQEDLSAYGQTGDADMFKAQGRGGRTMSLCDLQPGQQGKVSQVNARGAIRQRLLDMGLLPDVIIRVERLAPTGDPVWISLKGSQMALRRKEAEAVLVSEM